MVEAIIITTELNAQEEHCSNLDLCPWPLALTELQSYFHQGPQQISSSSARQSLCAPGHS